MFNSKVWRVIACGLIGLGAVAVVLSIGQTRVQRRIDRGCARRQRRRDGVSSQRGQQSCLRAR